MKKKADVRKSNKQASSSVDPNLRFLVVDDDQGARSIIVDYLKSFGFRNIAEARDGNEAIQQLRVSDFDFVISDWEMPGPSGLELLKFLKSDNAFSKIPFIMVTSPTSIERAKIEEAGLSRVDGYIIKPFRGDVLREKIEIAMEAVEKAKCRAALVVDDDDQIRADIVSYLRQMGYKPIYEALNGDEGFETLEKNSKDIAFVVCDWEMPKLTGIELLKKIRNDKKLHSTPFIMCTSQTSIERLKLQQAIQADVDNYLLKPFRVADLKAKIEKVVAESRLQTAVGHDLQRGRDLLAQGRWGEALIAFNQALAMDKRNVEVYLGLATAQRHIAPDKAIPKSTQYLRQAISINPKYDRPYVDLALIFESAMSLDKAISCLKEALAECPFSELVHYHLGRLMLRRGMKAEGITFLKKALELKPGFREVEELLMGRAE